MIYDLIIVGAGPAGIFAALSAKIHNPSLKILLIDKLDRIGGKLRYTAGGRGNIAHVGSPDELISKYHREQKFLYPAFYTFSTNELINYLHTLGIETYSNDEGRIYPLGIKAIDLENLFYKELEKKKIDIYLSSLARSIRLLDEQYSENSSTKLFCLEAINLINNQKQEYLSRALISACGCPASSKISASKKEAYFIQKTFGLPFINLSQALAPIKSKSVASYNLAGISVDNTEIKYYSGKKLIATEKEAILFTHIGLSGPAILNISREIREEDTDKKIEIDFIPELDSKNYSDKKADIFDSATDIFIKNKIPKRLRNYLIDDNLSPKDVVLKLKKFKINDIEIPNFDRGMQCRGGLDLKNIDPRSMESKSIPYLYFVGDQLNLDGPEGGYNLLLAFSTGYLAGLDSAEKLKEYRKN